MTTLITITIAVSLPLSAPAAPLSMSWVGEAAAIVAAATPHGCPECTRLAVCTLLDDATLFDPWALVLQPSSRWSGRSQSVDGEVTALLAALLNPQVCAGIPRCSLFGNTAQLVGWGTMGANVSGAIVARPQGGGWGVACVPAGGRMDTDR